MGLLKTYVLPHPPLIVKEVGNGSEEKVIKTIEAYKKVADEIANLKPNTIIISSPHAQIYNDYFHISPNSNATGSFEQFGAKEVTFNETYDEELVREISQIAKERNFPAGTFGEKDPNLDHGTMVPLYFIEQKYKDFKLVRIGLSNLTEIDHYQLGEIIKEAIDKTNRKVVYIASGDLSHRLQPDGPYGITNEGIEYEKKIMDDLSNARFNNLFNYDEKLLENAGICGHHSFIIMSGVLDGLNVEVETLSHEDITGVGYGICTYTPKEENSLRRFRKIYLENELKRLEEKYLKSDDYIKLARNTIIEYIKTGNIIPVPEDINSELINKKAGVFVSIHKFGKLRGCIGTIIPTRKNIATEIIYNAISASTNDNRFNPIEIAELPYLDIKVDVLGPIEDIDSREELNPKKYGVIVYTDNKRGLLLPDLNGIDTIEKQIEIAKRKANITFENYKLQRFEVIRHE